MQHFFIFLAIRNLNWTTHELFFSLNQQLSIWPFGRRDMGQIKVLTLGKISDNIIWCARDVVFKDLFSVFALATILFRGVKPFEQFW